MCLSPAPNLADAMRRTACRVDDQPCDEAAQIEAAVEAVGEGGEVGVGMLGPAQRELAPEKRTPRGLLFLTLWRSYEDRTQSEVHGRVSGRGGEPGARGWTVDGGRRALAGDVEQVAGELDLQG